MDKKNKNKKLNKFHYSLIQINCTEPHERDSVMRKVVELGPWGDGVYPNHRLHLGFTFI